MTGRHTAAGRVGPRLKLHLGPGEVTDDQDKLGGQLLTIDSNISVNKFDQVSSG